MTSLRLVSMHAALITSFTIAATAQAQVASTARSAGEVVEGQTTLTLPDTIHYTAIERALVRLERRRSAAIARHDTAWLATLYSPDLRAIAANGRRVDRSALFGVFALDNPSARFLIDELEVRELTPQTATVTGRLRAVAADGSIAPGTRYMHVYVLRDGRWQLAAAEGTVVSS